MKKKTNILASCSKNKIISRLKYIRDQEQKRKLERYKAFDFSKFEKEQ